MDATSDIELADYRTELIKRVAAVEMRRQELAESEASLRRAREALGKTEIRSPIAGVVSKIHAKPGEIVITGTMNNPGTVIMVVTDLSDMQVRARVDETDVPLVSPDQKVDIFLPSDPQRAIPGKVLRVATSGTKAVGRDVVTFETFVLVESDDPAIKPGMTANVEIQVARKDEALTVPLQAVVHRKRKDLPEKLVAEYDQALMAAGASERQTKAMYLPVVFCMDGQKAYSHAVRTGISDESHVELVSGIGLEDRVITGPYRSLDQLKDGAEVKLEAPAGGDKAKAEAATKVAASQPNHADSEQQTDKPETADATVSSG